MPKLTPSQKVAQELANKTYQEIGYNPKTNTFSPNPKTPARSRVWQAPNAYRFLVQWTNLTLLRILLQQYFHYLHSYKDSTSPLTSSNYRNLKLLDRTAAQVLDAARSALSTLEEGWARPTTKEYLDFLGFSQASLKEVKGDIERLQQDGLLPSKPHTNLATIGINLKNWHEFAQNPANTTKLPDFPLSSSKLLKDLDCRFLTYQIFIELINKTDYTLRNLVASLETRLNQDHKYYQVERARIQGKLNWRK